MSQQRLELIVCVVERELEIDPKLGNEVVVRQLRGGDIVEPRSEFANAIGGDGHTRRGTVAAKAYEQIAARGETGVQIERADRSAGALPFVAVQRDEHRRAPELLDQSRRNDADHAWVPPLLREHDTIRRREIEPRHQVPRAVERSAIDLLASRVQLFELPRDRVGLMIRLRQKQIDAAQRAAQASRRIQPRSEDEPDPAGGERLPFQTGGADHRADAGTRSLVEELESIPDEHAILAA